MPRIVYDYYADFETTSVELKENETILDLIKDKRQIVRPQVYSWAIGCDSEYTMLYNPDKYNDEYRETGLFKDFGYRYYLGTEIDDFIDLIVDLKHDTNIWFNNSKGFDNHFLLPALKRLGYNEITPLDIEAIYAGDDDQELEYLKNKRDDRIEKVIESLPHSKWKKWYLETDEITPQLLKQIKYKWILPKPGEFSYICNNNNQIYEIKIGISATKETKGKLKNCIVTIKDNLLIFPTSINGMAKTLIDNFTKKGLLSKDEAIARFSKQTEQKGDYNIFSKFRDLNALKAYKNGVEVEYLIQDTYILFEYQKNMFYTLENVGKIVGDDTIKGLKRSQVKMTIASTAVLEIERTYGEKLLQAKINLGQIKIKTLKRGAINYIYKGRTYTTKSYKHLMKTLVQETLPVDWLDDEIIIDNDEVTTIHAHLFEWYNGGISHINEKYRYQKLDNVTVIDINSSYPNQMSRDTLCPVGEPIIGDDENYPFKIMELIVNKRIENKTGLPFIYDLNARKREYVRVLYPGMRIKINSLEYEYFKKYYSDKESDDYHVEVVYSFKSMPIKNVFGDFVGKWYPLKKWASINSDVFLKTIIKLLLNSGYGKFGTKKKRESKVLSENENGIFWTKVITQEKSKYYLPLAIAITTLARLQLVEAVGNRYDEFIYCDTDSLFIQNFDKKNYPQVELDSSKLGAWDIEVENMTGIFRRPKQYFGEYYKDGKRHIKMAFAGINANKDDPETQKQEVEFYQSIKEKLTFDDFVYGKKIGNQNAPRRILGYGVLIDNVTKSINPAWEYDPLTQQKIGSSLNVGERKKEIIDIYKISCNNVSNCVTI